MMSATSISGVFSNKLSVRSVRRRAFLAPACIGLLTGFAAAQGSETVTINMAANAGSVTGELLGVTNEFYTISTSAGEIQIPTDGSICEGAACPSFEPAFQRGGEVLMVSPDQTFRVAGTLQDIDDNQYVVSTQSLGIMRMKIEDVTCVGPGCPTGLTLVGGETVQSAPTAPQAAPVVAARPEAEPVDPDAAKVRFAGSDTVGLGLLPYLLEDYADYLGATPRRTDLSQTEAYVSYVDSAGEEATSLFANSTGSGDAFDALEANTAEFGMASRQPRDEETQRLIAAGVGDLRNTPNETVIAVDSLAVITHPSNTVRDLDLDQIGAIYLGQITNWSQVGGRDAPITVLSREDGSSTRSVFELAVFNHQAELAERVTYPGGDNPEMAAAVRADPNAIGYVGFAYSEGLNRISLTSECGITSTATDFAVKTEEYPLGRRLYLYNRPGGLNEDAQRFLQYVLSPAADDAIAQSNFVNFAVERQAQPQSRFDNLLNDLTTQAELQLANRMRDDLPNWDRLSTTVRFPTGSSALGGKELNDLERLITYLEGLPGGTRVAITGFTDSVGGFENNLQLATRRAQSVARSIEELAGQRLDGILFEQKAYGELAPAVCNTEANGRTINRRVELWVEK